MAADPVARGAPAQSRRVGLRSIRVRILAVFVLNLTAFTGALGYGLVQLRDIGGGLEVLNAGYLPLAQVAATLEAVALQMDRDLDRYSRDEELQLSRFRSTTRFYTTTLSDGVARGERVAQAAQGRAASADDRKAFDNILDLLAEIEASRSAYEDAFAALAAPQGALEAADSRSAVADLEKRRSEIIFKVQMLAQNVEARIQMVSRRTARAQTRAYGVSGALALLAVVLAGALAGVALLTLRPIGQLTAQVQRLAQGELVGRVRVRARDEVGVLAREFNAMAGAVAERDRRLKERAEALDQLSLRLRRVLDSIRAGLVVVQGQRAETVNPAATALWGVAEGAPLPDFLRGLQPGRHEGLARGERLFDVDVVPFGTEGALVVGEDVTERSRDRERLARSERLATVGQMLAQITHEVRNPLNAMSLHAELLSEDLEGTDHHEVIDTITREIRRLEALTARYLELSRGRRPELSPTQPVELARDVVRLEEAALQQDGVQVRVSGPVDCVVELDVDALRRALRNLVLNAAEAGATEITLQVAVEARSLSVEVSDNGPGMSVEDRSRIFEPFFTTKAQGTGLGLAITRQELEDVGGRITVASDPGSGSVFRVTLPVESAEAVPPRPA